MKNIKYLLTVAFCFVSLFAAAQTRISGHVFNADDGPVVMANVTERDASNRIVTATQTDASGNFSMTVKDAAKNKLQVSYIGYKTEVVNMAGETTFRIEMKDNQQMDVAVVSTVRRVSSNGLDIPQREISTARQTLDMDNMEGLSFETAGEALQGQIAGLDVVMNSGNLGAGTSMRLRGVSTINGSSEPLIVVNGYILEDYNSGDLNFENMEDQEQFANLLQINVEDIKSINVLKDAAATAIWGARGTNGVIEIVTRRGARGKTHVSFSYKFSGSWQPEGMKMLSGDDYSMMLKEAYFNPQQSDVASGIVELMYDLNKPAYYGNFSHNTDWIDEVTQFGQTHNYNVAISGGGEKATFRVSGNYDHETGTIIKQKLDRFTTRLALDYYVSDRIKFVTDFSLSYTKNMKNYSGILAKAYYAMPNMSVFRYENDRTTGQYYNTGDYFIMPPAATQAGLLDNSSGRSSYYLSDMVNNGNPVAEANLAWRRQSTYNITPQFRIEYKFLGKETDETQLNYTGSVSITAYTQSEDSYYPQQLTAKSVSDGVNLTGNGEFKSTAFTTRHDLVFHPHFSNENHSFQMMLRGEMKTTSNTTQNLSSSGIAGGITSSAAQGYLTSANTSTSKAHEASALGTMHYSYGSKYSLDFTLRADGVSKFGSGKKWGYFPGISARWNISDENFFTPLRKYVNMLAVRGGWGKTGNISAIGQFDQYNTYTKSHQGTYNGTTVIVPTNLRLTTIRWEETHSWNLGFNLNVLDDLLQFDLNIYNRKIKDLINSGVRVPSTSGYYSLSAANVGQMENEGWELYINTKPIFKIGKFHANLRLNFAQNINTITQMDAAVLSANNKDFDYSNGNEFVLQRVQIGNALGGIYGFRYKGVYAYDYDHNGYFLNPSKNEYYDAYGNVNTAAATGKSAPIAYDAQGNVIYDKNGNPLPMYFNYGGVNYQFQGGDVMYEDINHDGQIDDLDIVYLGGSNPKITGGFGIDLTYGQWQLKTTFNFRLGNKILNMAKMYAENMRTNKNQMASVNWRWRKNGDVRDIPRAMRQYNSYSVSFNSLVSDRYVEKGDFLRFNYFQLSYSVPAAKLKRFGLNNLRISASGNNLIFWTRYSGVDPEHNQSGFSPTVDSSSTPRSRSFTFSLTFGF
ncbi:MAG: SusC/RagA family TonB-linked outer membrane protein [Bacteroidaceae bacterium]|nr:SusC/RagA family TonB-linked outer membrane protein [Bacteroidaceae bacterium]